MAWTTPSTWVAGAILTAAQLNQQLRDNMDAIGAPAAVAITTTTAQTGIVVDTWTQLAFASATTAQNTGGFTISSGGITVPTGYGGVYLATVSVQWDADSTGVRGLGFSTTAALSTTLFSSSLATSANMRQFVSGIVVLAAGASVCGVVLSTTASRSLSTSFQTQRFSLARLTP